ncbi:glycosyltransferase family 2 protein [Gemmatimonas sp.]|uniref:glycosyltransferase n=1 Tax=Gemmatimonas sp. TaxID=1962908 RepID=UPI003564753C
MSIIMAANIGLWFCIVVLAIYTLRHYFFTLNRLFGRHRQPFVDVIQANWPPLVVFVPAHNESRVVRDSLDALLACDYPEDRLTIVPIDDRSVDDTRVILVEYAENYPGLVLPFLRDDGIPGKAAALADAMAEHGGEIALVFDADYIPGVRLLKQLVAPFFDPEVGAVMGRVVPLNVGLSLLTRLLDLERAGGYQVDQQARMNLRLVPQYGGTVGGVRRAALAQVGGWNVDSLAEDTDLTFRLVINGWDVVYQNRSECYEEVPETWESRIRQIKRWAKGHNQALRRYVGALIRNRRDLPFLQVLDGVLLLGVFVVPLVLLLGWICTVTLFYAGYPPSWGRVTILAISSFNTVGNFAAFFQVAAASRLDGSRERIRMLPFLFLGFLVSTLSVGRATMSRASWLRGQPVQWQKTERHRATRPTRTP